MESEDMYYLNFAANMNSKSLRYLAMCEEIKRQEETLISQSKVLGEICQK